MDNPNQKPNPPRNGNNAKHKAAAKKKKYKAAKNISAQELERRMKQHEAALARRFASVSSPQLRPVLMSENSRLRGTQSLLQSLIDPDNAPPTRLPGGGKPTFVVKLRRVIAAAVMPAGGSLELTPNSGFCVKRRDPSCSTILFRYNATNSVYRLLNATGGDPLETDEDGWWEPSVSQYSSGYDRHGEYNLPWVFSDGALRYWFQNEAAGPSSVQVGGLTASTSYNLTGEWLLGGVTFSTVATALTTAGGIGTFNFGANTAGWARFRIATTAAPNVFVKPPQVYLMDNSNGGVCFLAAPGFWEELKTIDAIRTNAASIMYSDRTAASWSQGDIVAYQASGGDSFEKMLGNPDPTGFLNLDPYSTVTGFQDMVKGPYKKGRYMPLKFVDDPREQQMKNIADSSEAWELSPIIMKDQTDWLYIGFNFGPTTPTGAQPMGEWTIVEGDEGETESQWRLTAVPSTHPDVLKEAKWAFSQVKCDFENPSHLAKIWQWVKKNAPHILDVVGRSVGNAGPYGAAAAAGMGGAAEVLRLLP